VFFFVFPACMILLELAAVDSRTVIMSFARWRHFIVARGSNWRYARSVYLASSKVLMLFIIAVRAYTECLRCGRKFHCITFFITQQYTKKHYIGTGVNNAKN